MVKFQINDNHYKTPEGWHQVTFKKFLLSLTKLEPLRPKSLVKFALEHRVEVSEIVMECLEKHNADTIGELPPEKWEAIEGQLNRAFSDRWQKIPPKEKDKCHKFMALVVGFWCDIPKSTIIEAMKLEQLKATFWAIEYELDPNNATYNPNWAGFELDGVEYLPPSRYMQNGTVAEFAESAQYQENLEKVVNGDWLAMSDVMAVLCKPKGEILENNPIKHNQRKKLFERVTMDNVINTAFFLLRLKLPLSSNLAIYTLREEVERLKVSNSQTPTGG
jgi:hypothetical protein